MNTPVPPCERLWVNGHAATMARSGGFAIVRDVALATAAGRISWLGPRSQLPPTLEHAAAEVIDLHGRWVTPGLIDAHTHLAFAGNRANEFEQRLQGASYADIQRQGGGIIATVRAVQACTLEQLQSLTLSRARSMAACGVTTVEIKSGYGQRVDAEEQQLRAATAVADNLPMRVQRTYLGLHALPGAAKDSAAARAQYIEGVVHHDLPTLAARGLVDAVDAFCEGIAFTPDEVSQLFRAAAELKLPVKLHADQLSDCGGAALAASFKALSADHIEYSSESGLHAMAAAGTAAVLLPGAFHYLRETQLPPIQALRRLGIPMALASDCNPGTSPLCHPGVVMNLACVVFGMTPAEALAGYTREAARALGLGGSIGTLETGKWADLAIWDCDHPADLCYWIDGSRPSGRVFGGRPTPMDAL